MASNGAHSLFCHLLVIPAGVLALPPKVCEQWPESHFEVMHSNWNVEPFLPASGWTIGGVLPVGCCVTGSYSWWKKWGLQFQKHLCNRENHTGSNMAKIRSCWRVEIVVKMSLTVTDLWGEVGPRPSKIVSLCLLLQTTALIKLLNSLLWHVHSFNWLSNQLLIE